MLLTDSFIEGLREDPVAGVIELCDSVIQKSSSSGVHVWTEGDFELLVEAYSLIAELIEIGLLPVDVKVPDIEDVTLNQCPALSAFLHQVRHECKSAKTKGQVSALRSRFRLSLSSGFAYEFSQGDLERVQDLINQLRTVISAATGLDQQHQQRLLRRLERLQAELHKKVSDLDRFWGLIGDAGVVLAKLGNDAKPIVDRIKDIADIVWRTQSRGEELPSGTKFPQLEEKSTRDG